MPGAPAEAAPTTPIYKQFEGHRDGSQGGLQPVFNKSFHGTRFPLLADLLESHGWKRAEPGQLADFSFQPEAKWEAEGRTTMPARVSYFSRAFTDLMSNKRSFARALIAGGCADLMPETHLGLEAWEKEADTSQLWFLKGVNGSYSSDVYAVRSESEANLRVGVAAAGLGKSAAGFLAAAKQELVAQADSASLTDSHVDAAFANALLKTVPKATMDKAVSYTHLTLPTKRIV
eukprot:TRINITY_DN24004_c0_g1_i2.p1 TRINITY_DN24004_c0_g1~~TRINITY_DN24004_c0_g1_i2.p1  ORF type:complete len:232 (-),score=57.84 TRINITY_DN24004_c0_g1_i2:104-799(-)